MSFGDIRWFDVPVEIQRCDWLERNHGLKIHTGHIKKTHFSTNHSSVFPPVHRTTEFDQTTVWATRPWLTPPTTTEHETLNPSFSRKETW